jgi:hypothetical protein
MLVGDVRCATIRSGSSCRLSGGGEVIVLADAGLELVWRASVRK